MNTRVNGAPVPNGDRITTGTICCAGALLLLSVGMHAVAADSYPSKPIRIIVPGAAASGPDILARLVGAKLTESLGQPVVIDNRAGAGGTIAADITFRAAPDGYTLLMSTSQTLVSSLFFEKLPYQLLRDFSPISLLASMPFVLVANPSVPATSVKGLIALVKAKPGTLHYGSAGTGGALHLVAESFKTMADIDVVHVPYKSVVYALNEVVGGQVQLAFSVIPAALPLIKQGKLKALGVTSAKRTPLAPGLEAIAETVAGYEMTGWSGLIAPRKTPDAIIAKLNAEAVRASKGADIQEKFRTLGAEPLGTTPREFASFLSAELEKTQKTIKASGMRPD